MTGIDAGGQRLQARTSWRMRVALIASLMLNLAMLGIFAGTVWATRSEQQHAGKRRLGLIEFIETLPEERRNAVRGFIDSEKPRLRPWRQQVREARMQAASVLATEPFEKDKLVTAMQRLSETEHALHSAINGIFVEAAARMTPAERHAYQAWWLERWSRRKPGEDAPDAPPSKPVP
jgi:uncharacterized membrane protein